MENNVFDVCDRLKISDLSADFIGRGNIWINNCYGNSEIRLARYIIYKAISETALGQLSIIGYDKDLSGIFAPFSALASGDTGLLEVISDEKAFDSRLDFLCQHIGAVQNVIQGRNASLLDFRKSVQIPVESYKLVVLCLDMGMISQDLREKLSLLMRSGATAGVTFLIISTVEMSFHASNGQDIPISVDALAPNITVIDVNDNTVSAGSKDSICNFVDCRQIIGFCDKLAKTMKNVEMPTVRFDELHDLSSSWTESSTDGLTFYVGKYGTSGMPITIGNETEQRHNVLITGAVGQGKSNLISVIIHSLCLRYSPSELNLYLLDFKEGVTFKAFSNIDRDDYLPHAKTIGLESDVEFGAAVLESLYSEYKQRMRVLKAHNAKSIRELRMNDPDIVMPRIVVVIDEFQMMFGDDTQTGLKISALLEKSVRLFRAAGIHFILASQTLSGNVALSQKKDSIFSQVPIRIALKNSESESQQTLAMNNTAAADLRPREAIVNLDYGNVSQNRKTVVAFADEKLLAPIRRGWWEKSRSTAKAPYVFDSERRASVSGAIDKIREFRKSAVNPMAFVGNYISIKEESIWLPMSSEPGRNIAVIGTPDSDCDHALGIMQSIAVSLALQIPSGNARFIFCDFENRPENREFKEVMENAGYFIENISNDRFDEIIKELNDQPPSDERIFLFGLGLDRWNYEKNPYGQGSPLKDFTEKCTVKNMHFIGHWSKASAFTAQTAGYGSSEAFNSKIFLRLDERSVQSLTNSLVRWHSQDNRALLSDSIEFTEEMAFIPYAPVTKSDLNAFKSQIWD